MSKQNVELGNVKAESATVKRTRGGTEDYERVIAAGDIATSDGAGLVRVTSAPNNPVNAVYVYLDNSGFAKVDTGVSYKFDVVNNLPDPVDEGTIYFIKA